MSGADKESEAQESSGFYLGRDGEYYYDDGRPFPHPFTAKGIIAICNPKSKRDDFGGVPG